MTPLSAQAGRGNFGDIHGLDMGRDADADAAQPTEQDERPDVLRQRGADGEGQEESRDEEKRLLAAETVRDRPAQLICRSRSRSDEPEAQPFIPTSRWKRAVNNLWRRKQPPVQQTGTRPAWTRQTGRGKTGWCVLSQTVGRQALQQQAWTALSQASHSASMGLRVAWPDSRTSRLACMG